MADQVVTLRLTTNNDGLVTGIAQAAKTVGGLGAAGKAAGDQIEGGMTSARRGVQSISQSLASAKTQVLGIAQAYAGMQGVRVIANLADSWSDMTSRIRVNISASDDAGAVMSRLSAVARATYSSLESTAESFASNSVTLRALGKSTQEMLDYTAALNNALVVSGAKGQAFEQVQNALSKAMATGSLRGEELNSVLSRGTRVAEVLAAELGTNVIGLRQMGEEGQITGDVIFSALTKNMQQLAKDAGDMPATIGDAFTLLRNALLQTVGAFDQQNKVSESLALGLTAVADSIGTLVTVATTMGVSLAAAHGTAAAAATLQALAQRKVAATALAEAEAQVAKMRAMQATLPNVVALTAAEERLAAAQTAATAAGVGRAGVLARMGSGLLSLAGGPIGVAVLAFGALATVIYQVYKREQERIAEFNQGIESMQKATQATLELARARAKLAADSPRSLADVASQETTNLELLAKKQAEYNEKRAQLIPLEARIQSLQLSAEVVRHGTSLSLNAARMAAAQATLELSQLRMEMDGLRGATDQLTVEMRDRFAAFLANDLPAAARDAANALRGVWAAAEQGNLAGAAGGFFGTLGTVLDQAKARFLAADKAGVDAFESIKTGAKDAAGELADFGKTQAQIAEGIVNQKIAAMELAQLSPESIAAAKKEGAAWIAAAAALDAKKTSTKAATDAGADLVATLQEQVATYGLAGTALDRYRISITQMTPEQREAANAAIDLLDALGEIARTTAEEQAGLDALSDITTSSAEGMHALRERTAGASQAQIAYNKTMRDAQAAFKAAGGAANAVAVAALDAAESAAAGIRDITAGMDAAEKHIADIDALIQQFGDNDNGINSLIDSFVTMQDELDRVGDKMSEAFDPARAAELETAIGKARYAIATGIVGAAKESLQSIQSMTEEGSRSFQMLQVAIDATTIAEAVLAVIHQLSSGDVYSAIPRAIAVAAAIASLGVSIGNIAGGGFSDTAAKRQASQGTGTVLGDSDAKSESILKATEITADATSALVAINRGMLNALLALQAGLGSASGMLARGAGEADFSGFDLTAQKSGLLKIAEFGDPLWMLGGKSKVTDEGIKILGGLLGDIKIGAYQEVQSRSWAFGSKKTKTGVQDVSDDFGKQFQLIMTSIADTVREGALALGLLPADIEAALAAYRVEEMHISLKGLNAEEQQKELQAVFSSIFDGLAGSVVPFIEQFQRVGEGLGETLIRVATGVQVTREAMRQLGLVINETDPEKFAQISEGLIDAVGGIDAFISGMQSFVSAFAPESHKFAVASGALNTAFEAVGLSLPATEDGMWDLMQSLDATTAEGREQIATLLRLSGVAKEYYDLLDNQVSKATDYLDSLGLAGRGLSEFTAKAMDIYASRDRAIEAANTIAKAQGRAGASTIQLAQITDWSAKQMAAALRYLAQQTRDLIAQLYGGIAGTLEGISDQIADLEAAGSGSFGSIGADAAAATDDLFQRWIGGIETVQQYLDSMLLGDLSSLSAEEQLVEAQRQLMEMQAAAMAGDADALAQLPQLADTYLRMLRGSQASGDDFNQQSDWVRELLQAVVDRPNPGTEAGAVPGAGGGAGEITVSAELQALYDARDAAMAAADIEHRAALAQMLAENLHDLAQALNIPILEFMQLQAVALEALATDLGVNLEDLNAASVQALGNMAVTLGLTLGDLTEALGITLTDLAGGLTELTGKLGIDLANLTVETTQTLGALATTLGADLSDMAVALGLDLGALADAQSLLNQALAAEIQALPGDQATALQPLLDAISSATTEADANAAIAELEAAVNLLGGDTATALAPYLAGVFPSQALDELGYLGSIADIASGMLDELIGIGATLYAQNRATDVPGYAVGSSYIPNDHLAMVHQGEGIVDAQSWRVLQQYGIRVATPPSGDNGAVVVKLDQVIERLESLERSNAAGHGKTAATVESDAAKARIQRDELQRKTASQTGRSNM